MKKLAVSIKIAVLITLISCQGNAQKDLAIITPVQWQEDLDYLTQRINKSFAGFTPATRQQFNDEAAKVRASIPGLNSSERILEMARLLAILHDGHTELSLTGSASGFHRFPMVLYYFGQDLRVIATGKSDEEMIGLKLTKIDGMPVAVVFEKLKPYVNRDNDIEYITTAPYLIVIPEILMSIGVTKNAAEATLTLANDNGTEIQHLIGAVTAGQLSTLELKRAYQSPPMYAENPDRNYWYRYLPDSKVMYICLKYMVNQDKQVALKKMISQAFDEVDKVGADKVVIDVRLCRGGNYNNGLPIVEEIKKRPHLNKQGKSFIINGRLTFSAAAVTTVYVKEKTNTIVIGEVSRSRPNWAENMESYELPNTGLSFDCTDELRVHSERLKGSDIIPVDILIERSFENYKNGRDEVMEYIVSH